MDDAPPIVSLPPDWAFVLQLQAGTSFCAQSLHGRIEHVQTGHASMFASLDEARVFMERVMTTVPRIAR